MAPKNTETKIVQTSISDKLNSWLERAAKSEGISVAAFIRRLIIRAENQASKS